MIRTKHLDSVANTWVIGDLHGYLKTLRALFEQINPKANDRIIFLGDLVDRGPDVKGCFDFIIEQRSKGLQIDIILGNHDALMLNAWEEELTGTKRSFGFLRGKKPVLQKWLAMGGESTLASFGVKKPSEIDPKYKDFLEKSYDYISTDEYLLVHAGFDFESDSPFEDVEAMRWIREFKVDKAKSGGRSVIHGHTPVSFEFICELVANPEKEAFLPLDHGVMLKNDREKGRLLEFNLEDRRLLSQGRLD